MEKDVVIKQIEHAHTIIDGLCKGKIEWIMNVPAREDSDPDLVISRALNSAEKLINKLTRNSHTKEVNNSAELFSALLNFQSWTYTDEGAEMIKDIPDRIWFPIQAALKNSLPSGSHNNNNSQKCLCEIQPFEQRVWKIHWDALIKFNEMCPVHGK